MILENLEELSLTLIPSPGDAEIRHGCERAMTAILSVLTKIQPAEADAASPSGEEQIALAWLVGEMPRKLVDSERFACFQFVINRLLPY